MKRLATWLVPSLTAAVLGGCSGGGTGEGVPKEAQAAAPGSFPGANKELMTTTKVRHRAPATRDH